MSMGERENTIEPGQPVEVGEFSPENAAGIVKLFRAVYGEGYPVKLFYDAEALKQANASGHTYSFVARTPKGDVVGVQHLFRSGPFPSLYEAGAGLVLREYRNLGINQRMLDFLYNAWLPDRESVEETFGEPVCNHVTMQKSVIEFKHVETALEVALMPAQAFTTEKSAPGRVAAVLGFRCYKPKRLRVVLPKMYEEELRILYGRLGDERELTVAEGGAPLQGPSRADMTVFDFARVARIAVWNVGADFGEYLADLEARARAQKVEVFQVWLRLNSPAAATAVDLCRAGGYFFGGLLPRWFDDDGLLVQKLLCKPHFEDIKLYSRDSREILEMVKKDRALTVTDGQHGLGPDEAGVG